MELRHHALQVLLLADPEQKAAAALAAHAQAALFSIAEQTPAAPAHAHTLPGRPARPVLLEHTAVARRSPATHTGRAVLLHAIAHIEFNAINLALDAIWRFGAMPRAYYLDWLRVAAEEAGHFNLLRAHLRGMGHDYGDFPAHQGLWTMCEKTQHDVLARMALVPRTLEARGLDATPPSRPSCARWAHPMRWRRCPFSTPSCAKRWGTWPLATTGTAGCATSAALTPRRITQLWYNSTQRRARARRSMRARGAWQALAKPSCSGCVPAERRARPLWLPRCHEI